MNRQSFIASAVFTILVNCTIATADQTTPIKGESSKVAATTDNGIPTGPLYFSTRKDAENALVGYNYALTLLQNGRVQAIVSGLNGSGQENPLSVVQAESQKSVSKFSDQTQLDETETPFPKISLKEKLNGQSAIDALGDKLPLVAKAYDMSAERLEDILKTDQTAWIDEGGRLLYVEADTKPIPRPEPKDTDNNGEDTANATTISGTETFASTASSSKDAFTLHSKSGSNRVIYLDFNGHVATNTAWSSGTLTAQAYDIDGNPGAFSDAELSNIREIWQRVAEDYAPFDVDVTTQEPTTDAIRRTSNTDTQYGTRAVITRSMPELCSQSCGGVAYVNVFSYYSSSTPDRYQPAWAFFDKLGNGYPKYVAEAVSHEVGHNLNLNHDGTSTAGYYTGQGSGATGWAPIMGASYYKPVTQWSKGEYPGANNLQDDIAVISAAGTPLRPDDYPSTNASAAPLSGEATAVYQTGIIERNSDIDVFTFQTDGGNAQFNIASGSIAPDLDVAVKLMDSSGNTIASINPSDSLSASLAATLAAGRYFLQIDGVGHGDLTTGYSDYASLGQYLITGSYPKNTTTLSQPTADISALPSFGDAPLTVAFNGSGSTDQDGNIAAYDWNFGDGSANANTAGLSHIYTAPGTFTATLTVTDNSGLKNSTTQTISVTQSTADLSMKVGSTSLTRKPLSRGKSQCVANVIVKYDASSVAGATVYGSWSGSVKTRSGYKTVTGSTSGSTKSDGTVTIGSSNLPSSISGTCAFTVTNVVKSGYTYDGSGQIAGSFSW
ncbi:MAG: PKD domain-containing protein [Methylomonas sp.]|jgi:PKD repeat protein|uniref:PKD domain-containing protein n=1 Tax=Methylomonas sp. TaxID=418 RepID=UPI0025CBDB36|nr:PKD domain-containing protein [Methylomonas sp.]MCK9608356.1 PKD domain-containing protein [Methylomonas sp.]